MKYTFAIALFMLSSNAASFESIECYYYTDDPEKEVIDKDCLTLIKSDVSNSHEGDALITKKVVLKASYDESDLSFLMSKAGMFYFNRSGLVRRALTYDNGPDYFSEGLARTIKNNKIGFFDKKLNVVIKPEYDFGFPFNNGKAIVCNECKKQKNGEYSTIVGGKWGIIDARGNIIVPIEKSKEEIQGLLK